MSINNSIADRRTFEWKSLSTLNTLPYQSEGDANVKVGTSKGEASLVNRTFKKLVDNDLYNEQLVLNIKEGRNIPGATVTNLSQRVLESEDGHKFALTSIADPHIIIGKRKIADNDDMVSCVPFFKGEQVNFCILDGRQYVVGTKDGIYCSGERYDGWHRVGEHGDDYFLDSFEGTNCKCCIHNDKMGQFGNRLDNFEFFMGTNRGVWGFSLAYDYGDDVHWEAVHYELLDTEINFLQLDEIEKCLFIGTNRGLFKSDGTTVIQEKKSYKYNVNTLATLDSQVEVETNQRLLIGTPDGMFQSTNAYFPKAVVSMHDSLADKDVTSIGLTEDQETVEFIGTSNGLYRYAGKNVPPTLVNVPGLNAGRVYGTEYVNGYLYVSIAGTLYGRPSDGEDSDFVEVGGSGNRYFREIYRYGDALLVECEDPTGANYLYYVDTLDEPIEEIVLLRAYKSDFGKINSITVHEDDAYVASENGIHIFKLIVSYGHILNKKCAIHKGTDVLYIKELQDGSFIVSMKEGDTYRTGILSRELDIFSEITDFPEGHCISWAKNIGNRVYVGVQKEDGTVGDDVFGLLKLDSSNQHVECGLFTGIPVYDVAQNGDPYIYVICRGSEGKNTLWLASSGLDMMSYISSFDGDGPRSVDSILGGSRVIIGLKNELIYLSTKTQSNVPVFALDPIRWLNGIDVGADDDGVRFIAKNYEHSSFDLTGISRMSRETGEMAGSYLSDRLVYHLLADSEKTAVAVTNIGLAYTGSDGNLLRMIRTDRDAPNRHLLMEEDFGEVRTGTKFLLSSDGFSLDFDVFQVKSVELETGAIINELSTGKEMGLDYFENIVPSKVVALEHLRKTDAGNGAIAIGSENDISVYVPTPRIWSLSSKLGKDDILRSMSDEIAGNELTFYDGDASYFALKSISGKTYFAKSKEHIRHDLSTMNLCCEVFTYSTEDGDYGIVGNSPDEGDVRVDNYATCKGTLFLSAYRVDEIQGEDNSEEFIRVSWEEMPLVGLSGNGLGVARFDDGWAPLFTTNPPDIRFDLMKAACLNIGSIEVSNIEDDFLAKTKEHAEHDLSAENAGMGASAPMFLVEDPDGARHVFIDDMEYPRELTFEEGEVPIFLGSYSNCAIVATNKAIRYICKADHSRMWNFSQWTLIPGTSGEVSDAYFYGTRMDIVGVAIIDGNAKRFTTCIGVLNDREIYPETINWGVQTLTAGSSSGFRHVYSQFKKTESEEKTYILTDQRLDGLRIAAWAGQTPGYVNAVFLVDDDGNIYRFVYEKDPTPQDGNRRRSESAIVSGQFLAQLDSEDDTFGIIQYGDIDRTFPDRVYLEIRASDGRTIRETKVIEKEYDLSTPTATISIPSGKLQTLTVQAVPVLENDLTPTGNENLFVGYTYGASDDRTDNLGVWIASPEGVEINRLTTPWAGIGSLCLKIRDVSFSDSTFDGKAYFMLLAEDCICGGIGRFTILGYGIDNDANNISFENDPTIISDDDIFVKNGMPIEVYGFIRGEYGGPRLITGPAGRSEAPIGYSACNLTWTGFYKVRVTLIYLKTLDMSTSRTATVTNFVPIQEDDNSLIMLAFNDSSTHLDEIYRANIVEDIDESRSVKAGDVAEYDGIFVNNLNKILYPDISGGRLYFIADSNGNRSARSIDLNNVLASTGGAEKFPVTYLDKVSGTRANAAAKRFGIDITTEDERDTIIFGAINGLYTWGKYINIVLNVDSGETDLNMGGHIAYTMDQSVPKDEYYNVTHCAVWDVSSRNKVTNEDEISTNYAFTFNIEVYGVRFSFLSSNIEDLTMQTDNVCDGIYGLADGNYLLNFRDTMKVIELRSCSLINLELEDLERMYSATTTDDDDTIYNLSPMTVSDKRSIYFMVNGTVLAAFKDYSIQRCFERPRGDYKILQKRFWNRDVREVFKLSNRDFIIGTTDGSFFVRNLEICTCYLDKYGKRLRGNDEAITYCHQDMSKGFAIKYLFCADDKIYYTTDTINCGEEITTLPVETRIIYILAENDTMYDICTNKGLFITDLGYDIDDELHRFSIEAVSALAMEDLEPLLKGHIVRNHEQDEFWRGLYTKAPAALSKVPPGFTSTAGLDLNNAVYVVADDVVSYVEFNDDNKYIKASVKNWATEVLQGDAIYSTDGYIDRLEMEDTGKVYDMSKLSYSCKFWESGLREFIIYVPTTMTFYMNNPEGYSNSEYSGKSISRPNVSTALNAANMMSKSYTSLRIILNNEHYKLKNISHIQINGNSLPLRIYKDSEFCQSGRENLFDGVIQPSVVMSMPSIDPSTNDTQNNVGSVDNGLGSIILEFAVYGSDAQSIRIMGNV